VENAAKREYKFFVDAQLHDTEKSAISGLDIKQIASIPATYQLYLEEEGDTPDKPISDGDTIDLKGREKHFFAVPPATFGIR
jgi:Multiubiquitin